MTVTFTSWLRSSKNFVNWNYIVDRMDINFINSVIRQTIFEKNHPMYPWITIEMINILKSLLKKNDVGFEFGSGNSTAWFAKNTKYITSVEDNQEWFDNVGRMLEQENLKKKAKIYLIKGVNEDLQIGKEAYIKPILKIKNESLDYCFVDGYFRDECILASIPKLKRGGILIVDNVDTYFPKNEISVSVRYKRDNMSKAVSKIKMRKIYKILEKWRCIWTSCGIQDTALWIKP